MYKVNATVCACIVVYAYYLYGASARADAAISGSHLSPVVLSVSAMEKNYGRDIINPPFVSNFSLLYNNSSLVSVAYSAFGAVTSSVATLHIFRASPTHSPQ